MEKLKLYYLIELTGSLEIFDFFNFKYGFWILSMLSEKLFDNALFFFDMKYKVTRQKKNIKNHFYSE